jgi:ketosteroid isomerase-like protein
MQEQQNIDLIKRVYAAFGKGDIDTIIDALADQLTWRFWRFDVPSVIPYAGEYKTPEQVKAGFFGSLASTQKGGRGIQRRRRRSASHMEADLEWVLSVRPYVSGGQVLRCCLNAFPASEGQDSGERATFMK